MVKGKHAAQWRNFLLWHEDRGLLGVGVGKLRLEREMMEQQSVQPLGWPL